MVVLDLNESRLPAHCHPFPGECARAYISGKSFLQVCHLWLSSPDWNGSVGLASAISLRCYEIALHDSGVPMFDRQMALRVANSLVGILKSQVILSEGYLQDPWGFWDEIARLKENGDLNRPLSTGDRPRII